MASLMVSPSDHGYVSFLAYYNKWKREYPRLKVSRPTEDICNHCFVFANHHRYLAPLDDRDIGNDGNDGGGLDND